MAWGNRWRQNEAFCKLAKFHWAEDFRLATMTYPVKGRTEARRRMDLRWEGFAALPRMADVAEACAAAASEAGLP